MNGENFYVQPLIIFLPVIHSTKMEGNFTSGNNTFVRDWYYRGVDNQKEGIELYKKLKEKNSNAMLISVDRTKRGIKRFVVCIYDSFVKTILNKPFNERNFYEVS